MPSRQLTNRPTATSSPSARPANHPRLPTYRAPPVAHCQVGPPCVTPTSSSSSFLFTALADAGAKARPRRSWPPSRRAPRPSGASLPSTYTPRYRRYKKLLPPLTALPTLAALGDSIPCPPTRKPEEKEKGKRRRSMEAPGAAPPAAKPEPPARRSRTRGSQARLRPPASSASSTSRRLSTSPTSAASFLVTAPHTPSPTPEPRPVAT
jgi:hypothetical protein